MLALSIQVDQAIRLSGLFVQGDDGRMIPIDDVRIVLIEGYRYKARLGLVIPSQIQVDRLDEHGRQMNAPRKPDVIKALGETVNRLEQRKDVPR